MKKRLTALALTLCLAAGLCACAAGEPAPSDAPAPSPEVTATPEAETLPEAEHDTLPAGSEAPAQSGEAGETNSGAAPGSDAPAAEPSPTPDLMAGPTAPPSQAPGEEAPAKAVTAADVYAAVSAAAGVSYDNSTDYIDSFYTTLDTGDLSDYVFYMPAMSGQIEEIFLARVSAGKLDAVKAACLDRQKAMAEDAAFYGATGAYVDSYQLVTQGDWVLFCVCEKAADAVSAFQDAAK